jgi:AraC-like DNA-binding protein/quercetin dioxygenase-like cupin family protein
MDRNKVRRTLAVRDLRPVVQMANYRDVPRGAVWGERTIPDLELILIVAGQFSYEARETPPVELVPGDVLLIPPDEWHTLRRLPEPAHAAFSCIHGELLPDARWSAGDYRLRPEPWRVTTTGADAAVHDLFLRCSETYEGYDRYRSELLETLAKELWIRLAEYWRGGGGGKVTARVRPMVSYLRAHVSERIGRRDLARVFHITPEHVNALFRRELGVTPTQFLHRERVMRAYRYLRDEGLSVKEAAARVGFDDPFYFSKVFRKVLKRTPSSVRRTVAQA